ncbi:condensin complex subunit 1-like [Diaphorina citri]|uniref:Condensin complex subunit 1-like n=1 Tax=Diaphorina citri TaxID=121845 RepID=A0A3Q0J5V7_DIACI|nr:condensin complex subunit 1-like [Diaphorina citri]
MDKSSNVVKYTVQLLKTMIESNPFAAKLGVQELKNKLEQEKQKLAEMEAHKTEDSTYLSLVEEWTSVHYPALLNLLPSLFEEGRDNEECQFLAADKVKSITYQIFQAILFCHTTDSYKLNPTWAVCPSPKNTRH